MCLRFALLRLFFQPAEKLFASVDTNRCRERDLVIGYDADLVRYLRVAQRHMPIQSRR